jgi:hypothetical protein
MILRWASLDRAIFGSCRFRSIATTRLSSCHRLSLFFFFLKREDVPSSWSTTCFPLP